jgi:uncharacterized protein
VLKRILVFLCAGVAWLAMAWGQNVLPVPALTARVIDQTGTLDAVQQKGIEDKLAGFEQSKGTQIAFLIVSTTHPEDIASYANRVGNTWKIGRKGVGDGVLLIVAKDDHLVRIEVAKTLEGAIPDLAAKQIIDDAITPSFRKGDFAGGLMAAADQIIARVNGEPLPEPKQAAAGAGWRGGFDWTDLAIFLFIAVPVVGGVLRGILGQKLGALVTGAGVGTIALLVTSSMVIAAIAALVALLFSIFSGGPGTMGPMRRGGWGGGGLGGGGGWGGSGGGGDFGGGGASGNW